eukprot:TRINITY_DN99440_c0_g1_i1.p1 TRINITY_DN99440_c0_g1~~TRINITY_DN99440_c0_g1_i1.p1  ORF type:complete len:184 (+),score=18.85 TRINITY_DN99440_c0_g1_i1:44-595(+)
MLGFLFSCLCLIQARAVPGDCVGNECDEDSAFLQVPGAGSNSAGLADVPHDNNAASLASLNTTEETNSRSGRRRRRRRWQWTARGDCTFLFFKDRSFTGTHWGWMVNDGNCRNDLGATDGEISSGTFQAGPGCTLTAYSEDGCTGEAYQLAKSTNGKITSFTSNQLGNFEWNDKIESLGCSCR